MDTATRRSCLNYSNNGSAESAVISFHFHNIVLKIAFAIK